MWIAVLLAVLFGYVGLALVVRSAHTRRHANDRLYTAEEVKQLYYDDPACFQQVAKIICDNEPLRQHTRNIGEDCWTIWGDWDNPYIRENFFSKEEMQEIDAFMERYHIPRMERYIIKYDAVEIGFGSKNEAGRFFLHYSLFYVPEDTEEAVLYHPRFTRDTIEKLDANWWLATYVETRNFPYRIFDGYSLLDSILKLVDR